MGSGPSARPVEGGKGLGRPERPGGWRRRRRRRPGPAFPAFEPWRPASFPRGSCRWGRAGEGDDKHGEREGGARRGHGVEGGMAPCRASAWPWARRVARDRSTEGPGVVVVPGGGRSVRRRSSAAWAWPSARRANTSASRARAKAPSRVGHASPRLASWASQRARAMASAAHPLARAARVPSRVGEGGGESVPS